jgi:ferredoxin-nitrite reductase
VGTATRLRLLDDAAWVSVNDSRAAAVTDFHVHLSGCTASCAQPQIADVSLRGMKTRKDGAAVEALDVGLGGGLGENPQFADWVEMRVPADEVPGYIQDLLQTYEAEREGDETFRESVARQDEDDLQGLAEPSETDYEDPYMHNTKMTWYPYADEDDLDASPAPTDGDGDPLPADD